MADGMSEADKIRQKRLAKLGGSAASAGSHKSPPTSESSTDQPEARARSPATSESVGPVQAEINPFSRVVQSAVSPSATHKISITPATEKPADKYAPRKRSRSGHRLISPAPAESQPLDVWQDKFLRSMFRLSFDATQKEDSHGHKLHYIGGVREDLESANAPLKMSPELLDSAIIEVGASPGARTTTLDYLVSCWRSLSQTWNRTWKARPSDERRDIVESSRRLCLNYCVYAVALPDMFGAQTPVGNALAEHLLLDQESPRGLDHDFLTELDNLVPDMEEAREAFAGAIESISQQLRNKTMNDDHRPAMDALRIVTRYPNFVEIMAESPLFLPDGITAANMEVETLLGPFFQISPLQQPVTLTYFSSPQTRDRAFIANTQEALRMSLRTHQTDLQFVIDKFIKRSPRTRNRMLDWFARAVNLNHKRRALQVDQNLVSSDGFMVNVTSCLDTLCEPFMDAQFSKLEKIDPDYLRRKPRVEIADETKINADQKTSDAFFGQQVSGQSNFISEIFFLTVASHHYGTEAAGATLEKLEKDLRWMEQQIKTLEADRVRIASTRPSQLPLYERALEKYKAELDKGLAYKLSIQAILLDRQHQTRSMQFMRYVIVWMLHIVSPDQSFPKRQLQLPLPEQQPDVFACLPEYFFDDVVSNFRFIVRNLPDLLTSTQSEELIMLCITFLRSSEYIKNPYLKAGLVTIMFAGTWPVYNRTKGVLSDALNSMQFCTKHLLHSLMKFYIEVENTGANSQFYDKFNIRYEIFQIIKSIWGTRIYKDNLEAEAKVNLDFFVRFVNLLLNDVTYVLDEALTSLYRIHELQELLKSPQASGLGPEVRQEKESALADAQGKAKSYMQLTNETMEMLKLFTETLPISFTQPEIVQRLADMLDYNLEAMVGPKAGQLRVEDPKKYHFDPRGLLKDIISVYMNLKDMDSLVQAVARDGRSYKDANFHEAARILKQKLLMSPAEITDLLAFADNVKLTKEADDREEEDLGEIPDEFLDPLMFSLMKDPVILPISRTTIDRSTIRSHLLSDPNDPFNRTPLKIEDVVEATDLKKQIEQFIAGRKAVKAAERGPEAMDTS